VVQTPRNVQDIVEKVRAQCLSRGAAGIKGLGAYFRLMDENGNKSLTAEEFGVGMTDHGIILSKSELAALASAFDTNGDGSIDFDEFLIHIRPPMNDTRRTLVESAFNKLDGDQSGIVTTSDVARLYDPKHHPKYVTGEWDAEKVFIEFLRTFQHPGDPDGQVTREEFYNYYSGVSASIDLDVYFDLMMRNSWKL